MILTPFCPHHLTLVLQVKIGARRERELLNETNIDVEKNETRDVKRGERDVTSDPNVEQEGSCIAMIS